MKKLIIASNNKGKIKEIKGILKDLSLEIVSLSDAGIDIDVVEDGNTFEENARKKSEEICKYMLARGENDFIVVADDSGLEVEYLDNMPGVYSARYAGEHGNDKKNNEKLIDKLKCVDWDKRKARFVCNLSIIDSENKREDILGFVEGYILDKVKGDDGFGYDPLFFYPEFNKSFAEMSLEEKNKVSHRAVALKKFKTIIKDFL